MTTTPAIHVAGLMKSYGDLEVLRRRRHGGDRTSGSSVGRMAHQLRDTHGLTHLLVAAVGARDLEQVDDQLPEALELVVEQVEGLVDTFARRAGSQRQAI